MGFETPIPPETVTQKPVIDMAPILERVPPIDNVFSPSEELQKLWNVPKDQRREAVASFKDKLARQREAWASCRTSIEERIDSNPDLPREEMVGIIGEFASQYGFSPDHVKVAESLIDDYMEMHKRVYEIREKYPDDIALISHLTGMKFTQDDADDFEIAVGPMSIEVSCPEFNAGRIYERSEDPVVGYKSYGFASLSRDKKPVYYIVLNKYYEIKDPISHATTLSHEQEHQKNRILKPRLYSVSEVRGDVREQLNQGVRGFLRHQVGERLFRFERDFENEVFQKYESEKDPQKKAFLLAEYMRLKREIELNRAKDEIIARKTEPDSTWSNSSDLFAKGNAYDFLEYIRNWDKKKDDPLWQETAQRVLVDEYRTIIDRAIVAFDQLRNNGHSQAETIAMLTDKRLAEWPKTVGRLLEQKEERQ